jgi:glycosyltransferase involved in cell wall biosynthesis
MGALIQEARWLRRKLIFATPAPHLIEKLEDCYGVEPPRLFSLPNPLRLPPGPVRKSEQPSVVFLGRLDPIKRPWIFVELARRFPAVTFRMLGQSHFQGPGAYVPENLPPNLHLLGHTDETEKARWLREAWVAVNCSIHEALAVSILESFACETPVLSCQDPGYLVSRFGHYAGRFDGSGMEGLDAFAAGLRTLLTAREATLELGRQARAWVESQHSEEHFLERFARLRAMCGLSSQ